MRRATSLLLTVALLASTSSGAAQKDAQPSAFTETVDVEVVNVDVYVTDRVGDPVIDLGRDDFILLRDGKRIDFDYFYASGEAAGGRLVTDKKKSRKNTEAQGADWSRADAVWREPPHVVVFVDNANIAPASRNRVLRRLTGFVDTAIAEGARVMVVTNDGSPTVRLEFSDDAERIAAVLAQLEGVVISGFDRQSERRAILAAIEQLDQSILQIVADQKAQRGAVAGAVSERPELLESELQSVIGQIRMYAETQYRGVVDTVAALDGFVELLGRLPGRKAIVHVSDGLAVRPGQEMIYALEDSYQDGMRLARVATPGPDGQETRSFSDDSVADVRLMGSEIATYDATRQYRQMLDRANAGRVTFYTINGAGAAAGGGMMSAEISGGEAATFSGGVAGFQAVAAGSDQEGLRLMADASGGLALSGAGVEGFLDRLVGDMTSYYSLGFVPDDPNDTAYHELEVKLKRNGLTVRHREGYSRRPSVGVGERAVSALLLGFEDNHHGLALRVARQEHSEEKNLVHMLLEVPIGALTLAPGDGRHRAAGTIYVVTRPEGGDLSPLRRFPFSFEISDDEMDEAMTGSWGIQMVLELGSGPHAIAVALSDQASGAGSIVRTAVDVRNWGDPFGP